jgi:starvation-inducible DNA-binding protein
MKTKVHGPDAMCSIGWRLRRSCLRNGMKPAFMGFTTGRKIEFTGRQSRKNQFMNTTIPNFIESPKMYETENDLPENRRSELNLLMNQRLADAVDLQMQMKQAHWNVKGPSFIGLHELFDKVDEAVESYVDMIAERIVQLGGIAEGTVRVAASRTRLPEYPLTIADGMAHVEAVARALSTFGAEARATINAADELDDADTADLFTEVSRGIDKWVWFVEAHSQAPK